MSSVTAAAACFMVKISFNDSSESLVKDNQSRFYTKFCCEFYNSVFTIGGPNSKGGPEEGPLMRGRINNPPVAGLIEATSVCC